ncbi:carboxylesterase/lipase family protein [Chryseobacterium paludis]|uniref:carboxylesterase/lipase family protein n=1 Tax=Chryseobacterium paludis TaxID=2956784 RepID=UPI0021C013B2|nr:carboxylesterase/lipase family protein [Chryseobacterium paludis]
MNIPTLVSTQYGKVHGAVENGIAVWKGIPYAQAPINQLRFKAPKPPQSWSGIKDTTAFSAIAPQISPEALKEQTSEDCLFLNIWSPAADNSKRPVLFWIHGGAFVTGSGSTPAYNGASFAKTGNVVVVTINYRLGPFGFLYTKDLVDNDLFDSNNGLRDQLAALEWVKENIAAFGGDPENITIFGESAGGASVVNQLGSPLSKGLFHKAIAQSPCSSCIYTDTKTATQWTIRFLKILGLGPSELTKLIHIPVDTLLKASTQLIEEMTELVPGNIVFQPIVGDDMLPLRPEQSVVEGLGSQVPLIVGSNEDEGTMFALLPVPKIMPVNDTLINIYLEQNYPNTASEIKEAYREIPADLRPIKMGGDASIWMPAVTIATAMLDSNPVFMYRFRWASDYLRTSGLCSFHSLEIPFAFGNLQSDDVVETLKGSDEKEIQNLSQTMQQAWLNFAHTGNPNKSEINNWPLYNKKTRASLVFDKEVVVENDIEAEVRKAWENN